MTDQKPRLRSRPRKVHTLLPLLPTLVLTLPFTSRAQDNYEIQVYGSETVEKGKTMVEFHSNFTGDGRRDTVNGVYPTQHAFHETLEITHGFTPWFETGFYVFTSYQEGGGYYWVGDHIRPRVSVPQDWDWPVGLSLSAEIGYQQPQFSEDTWSVEIRPIIDKQWGRWYFSVNPAFEKSLKGQNSSQGFDFAPAAKIGFDLTKVVSIGAEYYGSFGPVGDFPSISNTEQIIYPVIDLNLGPDWEFNFGVGIGLTKDTDSMVFKLILGRRF